MSVERENAVINNQIILRTNFRFSQTGDYFDPYAISKVEILDSDGETVLETITSNDIIKDATGKYHVIASAISTAKTIYDKWYFTPAAGATAITKTNTCVVWKTAAGEGGLTTLNALREYLKKDINDTADDTLLQKTITRVSAEIEKRCNRIFLAANYTEYYAGNGGNKLCLKHWPVNSIASLYIDDDRQWESDDLIDSDDIIISDELPGLIILDNGELFSKTINNIENIKITYNAGYATIPSDLEQRCIEICVARYMKSGGLATMITKQQINPNDLEKEAWDYIESNYRAISF